MNILCRLVLKDNKLLEENDLKSVLSIKNDLIIGIDGSTSNTGVSLLDYHSGVILGTLSLSRDKDESAVRYKINFKRFLFEFMSNLNIKVLFYEQPFISVGKLNVDTVKALYGLRASFEEIKIENEPRFDSIDYIEVPNTKWKSVFLGGNLPSGTDNQKKAVRDFIVSKFPMFDVLSEDETDSIGIGFAGFVSIKTGSAHDIEAKKRAKPFKYNIKFIGADDDEEFICEFAACRDSYNIPNALLSNDNLSITSIGGKGIFNNYLYSEMGDDDKVIILKFSSKHHSNVVLEHRIANAAKRKYIYAIVWRKSRHISRR